MTPLPDDEIKVLGGLEAIRQRPAMYVGDLTAPDLPVRLLCETSCHAIDQHAAGRCHALVVEIDQTAAKVRYDAGMSLKPWQGREQTWAMVMLTKLFACRDHKHDAEVGQKRCGVGITTVNALSERFDVRTFSEGQCGTFRFRQGVAIEPESVVPCKESPSTTIDFMLDAAILESNTTFDPSLTKAAMQRIQADYPQLSVSHNAAI